MQPTYPGQPQAPQPNYEFIVNPGRNAPKLPFKVLTKLPKPVLIVVGLIILGIMILIFISGSNSSSLLLVAQRQQTLILISTLAADQPNTSSATQDSANTIKASVGSAQDQLIAYSKANKLGVSMAVKKLRLNTTTSSQLATAATAGTYDTTYKLVIKDKLATYSAALKTAYIESSDVNIKDMLNTDYNSAQLLSKQLGD